MSEGIASSAEGGSGRTIPLNAYVCLGLMVLIGSSTATAAKFAVKELPVGLVPIVRFGVAGLVLLPFLWRDGAWRRMLREDGRRAVLTAAFCVPINQAFFLNGTRLAPTTHVGLIYAVCRWWSFCWPGPWARSGRCRAAWWASSRAWRECS